MSEINITQVIKHISLKPGTIVDLTYKCYTETGALLKLRKTYTVIKDYGYHILFVDILNNRKLSITKSDILTDNLRIRKHL